MVSFIRKMRSAGIICGLASLLASCGGGASSGNSMLPSTVVAANSTSSTTATSSAKQRSVATTSVAISIAVPKVQTQSSMRSLQYVSQSTKSASISISNANQTAQTTTINCTQTCAATVQVPVGVDMFQVALYNGSNATGNILSLGSATTTITQAQSNTVSVVFDGVPEKLSLNVSPSTWSAGTAALSTVTVTAYDASGDIIVGNQNYATGIALSNSDTSGATSLSQNTITSAATTATLKYSGSTSLTQETITAKDGALSASADVTIIPVPVPTSAPTIAQTHILTYQQQLASNQGTSFGSNYGGVAPYVNYGLTDAIADPALRAAGVKTGFYATVHTICIPLSYGECTPQVSDAPQSVFATTCNGHQVTFSSPSSALVQYQTDPAQSSALTTLMNTVITTRQTNSGSPVRYDFVFDDNAGVPGDSISWEQWYDATTGTATGSSPYCNYSNSEYINGMRSLYANMSLPAIANAFNPPDDAPAASTAVQYFSGTSNLWGAMLEYAYGTNLSNSSRLKESGSIWQSEENTQLATSNAHRLFVAYEHVGGNDNVGLDQRLYIYASLLLSFDNASLVMAEDGTTPNSHVMVNPEAQLVPTQPLVSQPTSISRLQQSGGAYAREFAACYYKGNLIGPCASVVNSSSSASVPMPALSRTYTHTAAISGSGIVPGTDNGSMTFTGSAPPATLAPQEAVIVFP